MKYSQCGQDLFALSILEGEKNGTFVDVGCQHPFVINNTILLEEVGWSGVSIDVVDFSAAWSERATRFVHANALDCDFALLFEEHHLPHTVDYLSVDLERKGDRYAALKQVFASGYDFKLITIEHDVYKGYDQTERQPQRAFLRSRGYVLVCADVDSGNRLPFEDWWVNPVWVPWDRYRRFLSTGISFREILAAAGVEPDRDRYR